MDLTIFLTHFENVWTFWNHFQWQNDPFLRSSNLGNLILIKQELWTLQQGWFVLDSIKRNFRSNSGFTNMCSLFSARSEKFTRQFPSSKGCSSVDSFFSYRIHYPPNINYLLYQLEQLYLHYMQLLAPLLMTTHNRKMFLDACQRWLLVNGKG